MPLLKKNWCLDVYHSKAPEVFLHQSLFFHTQNFSLTKQLLKRMLVNNTEQRISLLEILQDRELQERLENPLHSHWCDSDMLSHDT